MADETLLTPALGRLYHRIPAYTQEQQDAAWLAFAASPGGQIILDLLMVRVVLTQKDNLLDMGRHNLVIEIVDAIQQAEQRQREKAVQ